MAERKPSDDKAAFGVFPQLNRNRAKQDREAAKSAPVDLARGFVSGVAGAPGDLEAMLRIPYDYLRAPTMSELVTGDKTSKTFFPTSHDIEKHIPFKSDTPVSRAATGLGQLSGNFYNGPLSPLRVIGALPSAIKHGAEEFAKASFAGAPRVVKNEGGNWLSQYPRLSYLQSWVPLKPQEIAEMTRKVEAEEALGKLKGGDYITEGQRARHELNQKLKSNAVNQWIESNLGKYVKNEMGTPSDPVRLLIEKREVEIAEKFAKDQERAKRMADRAAEEVDPRRKANLTRQAQRMLDDAEVERTMAMEHTSHLPRDMHNPEMLWTPEELADIRRSQGFPEEGVGKTPSSQMWEQMSDQAIYPRKAGEIQGYPAEKARRKEILDKYTAYEKQVDERLVKFLKGKGFDDNQITGLLKMSGPEKADIIGDKKLGKLFDAIPPYHQSETFLEYAGKENPWVSKLGPEETVYAGEMSGLRFDHIIDVLNQDVAAGRIRPEQLSKMSMEQAVRRTADFDLERAKVMRDTKIKQQDSFPTYKEYPEGYRWVELAPPKELPAGYSVIKDDIGGGFKVVDASGKESVQRPANDLGHINVPFHKTEEEAIAEALKYDKRLEEALKYEGDTMGHCVGGYCPDVAAGKSRIYSLRDTRGEPHVTVEARPEPHPIGTSRRGDDFPELSGFEYGSKYTEAGPYKPSKEQMEQIHNRAQNLWSTKGTGRAGDIDQFYQQASNEILGPMPERIVQIKGKQNAKPKDEYLPFVQDFVKGGKWTDVGDFHNTGLTERGSIFTPDEIRGFTDLGQDVPMYLSKEDIAKLRQARGDAPPAEMKAGGKVTLSNNPDTMMLDLQNKKQSGGSVKNKVKITDNKDAMWLATQDQKFGKGGKVAQIIGEGLEALGITKRGMEGIKQLSPEEKAVLEKWGQKQAQEAERAKKVEKMAKESASKSPEESVKPAKASTGKRTATPPDFYRKMAETQGDEAVLRAARAGKHLKPDTSGGYVGAPRTVDSPQALGKMRRELDQDFADSVEAVKLADPERLGTWYDRAKSGMAQMTEPYQLPRTLEQHGVYSAGVAPESELTFVQKHQNSRVFGEPKMAYRGAGMRTLDRAVAADEPAEMGFKIGEYADKNNPRLPNTGLFGVNDFRRAQGMGYTDPQGNPWKAGVSDTMHPFMDLETALQVDRANKAATGGRSDWYGPHIQELPWVYGKAQDIYSRGSSKTGRYGGDPLEGIKMALQDANKTAIDYAYKHAGSATHEAIPGASTGHVPSMITAPLEERIAYGNTGRWDRPVPEAALSDMPEVGAGNRDVIYSALGHRQLPTIEASGAYLPEGASAYEMQPVKIARPLLDFPTGGEGLIAPETKQLMDFSERFRALNDAQEAFGYNLPNTMGDVGGKTSAVMDTRKLNPNRNLDPATGVPPTADQMGALTSILGDSGYGVAPTSRGATIFPFDAGASPKDMAKLLKSKREELQSIYPSEVEASLNSSGYGPGVGKYTPEGFTASEPFSGQATKGLLKEASYLPQSAVQNLSESEFVRQAIKEKMRRDAALPNAREDIQNTRKFFAEADWAKAVELIRKGMSPTAALAALGYSASSMAGEADR